MPGYLLTTAARATCPHGGQATFAAGQRTVLADGAPVLVASDRTTITGCPFTVGSSPSPCASVRWSLPATRVTVSGTAVLLSSSVGLCLNPASAPQGTLVVTSTQRRVRAT